MDIFTLNVKDIHLEADKRFQAKVEPYKKVLEQVFNRIKYNTKVNPNQDFMIYEIPAYVFGLPPIDIPVCSQFLKLNLEQRGFDVEFFHPNKLLIKWLKPEMNVEKYVVRENYRVIPYQRRIQNNTTAISKVNKTLYSKTPSYKAPNSFPLLQNDSGNNNHRPFLKIKDAPEIQTKKHMDVIMNFIPKK